MFEIGFRENDSSGVVRDATLSFTENGLKLTEKQGQDVRVSHFVQLVEGAEELTPREGKALMTAAFLTLADADMLPVVGGYAELEEGEQAVPAEVMTEAELVALREKLERMLGKA